MDPTEEIRFEGWSLQRATGELTRDTRRIRLQSQPLQVLEALLARPGELVTREDLIARLWPRGVVDYDTALNSAVRRLRIALGDSADSPRYIETIPKRGYRFIGCLEAPVRPERMVPLRRRGWPTVAALVLVLGCTPFVLNSSVTATPGRAAGQPASLSVQASDHFQLARFFFQRRSEGDLERARSNLVAATALDPGSAPAWALLSSVYWIETVEGRLPQQQGFRQVREAAERSLALDPTLAEARLRLAAVEWRSGDWRKGDRHFRRAAEYEPNHPLVLSFAASFAAADGRFDEAVELQRRSVAADPLVISGRWNLATWLFMDGRLKEARDEFARIRELSPDARDIPLRLAELALLEGRFDEALALAREMPDATDRLFAEVVAQHGLGRRSEADATLVVLIDAARKDRPFRIAEAYASVGDRERAFQWLDAAGAKQSDDAWIRYSPFLEPLHADPRWSAWLAAANSRISAVRGVRASG
jgi:DNA-binding winged helix-turn-helix (wHTH) protein/tetratricopeptide (TPR) repeat protein